MHTCAGKIIIITLVFCIAGFASISYGAQANLSDTPSLMGIPLGDDEDSGLDVCPAGNRIIAAFLYAWQKRDYRTMYNLIDEDSKKSYSFDQAKMDFQFLDFKEYKISSVRKKGDDFEYILSYGDWQYGNKDVKKMIIDGRTLKIKMVTKTSVFGRSGGDYF